LNDPNIKDVHESECDQMWEEKARQRFWKGASEIEVTGGSMSLTGEEQQQRGALLLQAAEKSSMPL